MSNDSTTTTTRGEVSSIYRIGETIIFKFEGNLRARVEGHQIIRGRVWIEARAAELGLLVPTHLVVGVEPMEDD